MGTLQETVAVYGLHALLWAVALWRQGARPCVLVMLPALALSWWLGEALDGKERIVANMMIDLGIVVALREMPVGPQEKFVALIALMTIPLRGAYATVPYMGHYTYAVGVNCAVAAQLLIAGGLIDDWARRADRWLDRLHPRLARVARHVAATP